jgi:hypothetical protein
METVASPQRAVEPGFVTPHNMQRPTSPRAQRGVVLFVAMMAIIALAMAGIPLDRAVATDATISGNVDARTHATLLASDAIERAVAALFETGAIANRLNDDLQYSYFASKQPGEDGRGVPRALQVIASYPTDARSSARASSPTSLSVDARACASAASADNCATPSVAAARGTPGAGEPPANTHLPSPFAPMGRRAQPRSCR